MGGTPFAFQSYLKASNTGTSDNFGHRVAIDGDTLVIGAPDEDSAGVGINSGLEGDNTANGSGAVYVFVRSNGVWSQQAYIKASNTEAGDAFGASVAISGNTLVVGATGEDSNATGIGGNQADNSLADAGAAYVFVRSGTTWSQQAYIKTSNTGTGDAFGTSVAISGNTLAVGATGEDSNATGIGGNQADNSLANAGAAYVFIRSGATWTQQAYVKASNTEANDGFGTTVGLDSDTLVVGAIGEDSNATGIGGNQADNSTAGAGAVYVFTRSGTAWSQQAYVKASNTDFNDNFGANVTIDGDSLAVGAPNESSNATGVGGDQTDNSAFAAGAVYVFVRSNGIWSQQAYIKASNTGAGDAFGTNASISGRMLVVGAPSEDSDLTTVIQGSPNELATGNGATNAGAVYTFVNTGGVWSQQDYAKAPNTEAFDAFGASVAVNGDTLVVGATGEASNATGVDGNQTDNSSPSAGAVYVFR
jgi:hypothetical protein